MKYDTVMSIDGIPIHGVSQVFFLHKSHKGKEIHIVYKRANKIDSTKVTPNESGIIGVGLSAPITGKMMHQSFNLFESAEIGFNESVNAVNLFIASLAQIFNGTLSFKESVGGPIMIAQQAGQQAEMGIASFLNFIAMLSVTLAVINILPLPALDGGHLVFVLIEAIFRREVSPKVKIAIQQVGVILLLLLMVFVIYNDFTR